MTRNIYIGRSGLGKTTLVVSQMEHICRNPEFKHEIITLSPSAEMQDEKWGKLKKWVTAYYPRIDEGVSYQVYMKAYEVWKKNKNAKKKTQLYIIFDDLGESTFLKLVKNGNAIRELVTNIRHFKNVHLFMLFQSLTQSMTLLRDNADNIFAFRIKNKKELQSLYETFCGDISKEEFSKATHKAWNMPWGYLHIDRTDAEETVYYAKTEKIDVFHSMQI